MGTTIHPTQIFNCGRLRFLLTMVQAGIIIARWTNPGSGWGWDWAILAPFHLVLLIINSMAFHFHNLRNLENMIYDRFRGGSFTRTREPTKCSLRDKRDNWPLQTVKFSHTQHNPALGGKEKVGECNFISLVKGVRTKGK